MTNDVEPLFDLDECTGCRRCIRICPKDAIEILYTQEQLAERERSFNEKRTELESTSKQLEAIRATCADKEADLVRRTQELSRREHVLAQRWMKLKNAKCPHCSAPTSTVEPGTPREESAAPPPEAPVAS